MRRKRTIAAAVLGILTALSLVVSPAFTKDASASAQKDTETSAQEYSLEFTKATATVSLAEAKGLFELFTTVPSAWRVSLKIKVTVKNNTDRTISLDRIAISEDSRIGVQTNGRKTRITVAPGKKKTFTVSATSTLNDILIGGIPTESQALKLLNGKSVKVSTSPIVISLEAMYANISNKGNSFTPAGDFLLTVTGGEVDVSGELK